MPSLAQAIVNQPAIAPSTPLTPLTSHLCAGSGSLRTLFELDFPFDTKPIQRFDIILGGP